VCHRTTVLQSCVGRKAYPAGAKSKRGLQGCRTGRILPAMSYQSHAPDAPEFWARLAAAAYLKTGTLGLQGLCQALGVNDEAGEQRYRRMTDEQKSPPAATVKRAHLALGIPLDELMALIPAEDDYEAVEANLTERYVHGNCA